MHALWRRRIQVFLCEKSEADFHEEYYKGSAGADISTYGLK